MGQWGGGSYAMRCDVKRSALCHLVENANLFGRVLLGLAQSLLDGTCLHALEGHLDGCDGAVGLEGNDPDCTDEVLGGQFKLDYIVSIVEGE